MKNGRTSGTVEGGKHIASIDIGSLTARLLIARKIDGPGLFIPLARKRAYIRLAEGFDNRGRGCLDSKAVERTIEVLREFILFAEIYRVEEMRAVTTGVVRSAANRDHFLSLILDKTGLRVEVISGEQEADLALKGVNHALLIKRGSSVVFDLGGGTTEFISWRKGKIERRSLSLGAVLLSEKFLISDPPDDDQIKELSDYIDRRLKETLGRDRDSSEGTILVGSGGTVTGLAAMILRMDVKDITPEKLNGIILNRSRIEHLFGDMKSVPVSRRMRLPGLDEDRAKVILGGAMVVLRIMNYFGFSAITVCCSDILEGILLSYLEGDKNE